MLRGRARSEQAARVRAVGCDRRPGRQPVRPEGRFDQREGSVLAPRVAATRRDPRRRRYRLRGRDRHRGGVGEGPPAVRVDDSVHAPPRRSDRADRVGGAPRGRGRRRARRDRGSVSRRATAARPVAGSARTRPSGTAPANRRPRRVRRGTASERRTPALAANAGARAARGARRAGRVRRRGRARRRVARGAAR